MRVVEATGWTWDYVRTLPLPRFWKVLRHYAEYPPLVDVGRAFLRWKPPAPRRASAAAPPATLAEAEAETRALVALMNGGRA